MGIYSFLCGNIYKPSMTYGWHMKSIKRVTLRMSDETMTKVNRIAEREGETRSHIMRKAINLYVFDYNWNPELKGANNL